MESGGLVRGRPPLQVTQDDLVIDAGLRFRTGQLLRIQRRVGVRVKVITEVTFGRRANFVRNVVPLLCRAARLNISRLLVHLSGISVLVLHHGGANWKIVQKIKALRDPTSDSLKSIKVIAFFE